MSQSTRWGVAAAMAGLLMAGCSGADRNPVQDGQSLSSQIARRHSQFDAVQQAEAARVTKSVAPLKSQVRTGAAVAPTTSVAEPTGVVYAQRSGYAVGSLGTFRLEVDDQLNGEIVFPRTGQTQGDKYLLGIDQFFAPKNVRLKGIERNGDKLNVTIQFSHPFPRPTDLLPPSTATKRLDLHVFNVWAGLLLNGSEQYFSNSVRTNTSVLANADSYREVGGLITMPPGMTANVFPGKWVANDQPGNTDPTQDNYDPLFNGWFGGNLLDPTGYGVFAQGSSQTVTFSLDTDGSPLALDFVILADYQDPRATPEPFKNRLPDPLDPTKLRYILPYGCGDLQRTAASIAGTLSGTSPRNVTVDIVDLDADQGTTPTFPNEGNLSLMPFSSGIKTVETSFPTGITASTPSEAAGSGSGLVASPKKWEFTLTNTGAVADGSYTGLIRVVDEENDNLAAENYAQLGPNLLPLNPEFPIQVYQALKFNVGTVQQGAKVINIEADEGDPSYGVTDGWTGPLPSQHPFLEERITDLVVDQVTGQPVMIEHGVFEGLFADDKWGCGFWIPKNDGTQVTGQILQFRNSANTPMADWLLARPDNNKGFIVADAAIDPAASTASGDVSFWAPYPAANTDGRGWIGMTDNLNRLNFPTSNNTFYGRPTLAFIYDANTLIGDVNTWITYYAATTGVPTLLTDRYGAAAGDPDPFPAHDATTDQAYNVDLAIFRGNLGTGTRAFNTNHLGMMTAIRGSAVATFDALPNDIDCWQFWGMLDGDDIGTTFVELWGDFIQTTPMNTQQGQGALLGAGPGSVNPATTGGFSFARDAAALFVIDSADDTVERYEQMIIEGDADTEIDWTYSNIVSAAGDITDPIDITVTKNNLVVVLDNGGPGGTNRLVVLDPADLSVLGTRDIGDTNGGDIDGGAIAIAADDSEVPIPGDDSAFVLVFDNPTAATPTGGMIWYTIADA